MSKLKLNEHTFNFVASTKYLDKLSFSNQTNISAIKYLRMWEYYTGYLLVLHCSFWKKNYYELIYPHLIYYNVVWGGAVNANLKKIFKLQKKAVRININSG